MRQDSNRNVVRVLAIAIAAVPFVFGALRLLETGNDLRYLLTALGAFATAATIFRYGTAGNRPSASPALLAALAMGGATLVAAAIAFGLGATSATAIWLVAFGFSLCATASGMLGRFGRPPKR